MTLKCVKETFSKKCCMICLENDTAMVIAQLNMPLEAVSSAAGERTKNPANVSWFWREKSFDGKFWWVQDDKWFQSLSWYVLIWSSTGESWLQEEAGEAECLKPWEGQEQLNVDVQCLLSPPDTPALRLKQTSTDTNGIWSAAGYKIRGAKYKTLFAII